MKRAQVKTHWTFRLLAAACVVLLAAFALCASGCVFSDTITERVYDNDPASIVDDTISPKLVNTILAEMKTEALPRLDQDEQSEEQEKEEEDLPIFDGDTTDAIPQMAAAQAEYQEQAVQSGKASNESSSNSENTNTGDEGESNEGEGESDSGDDSGDGEGDWEEVTVPDEGENNENDKPRENEDENSDTPNQRNSGTGDEYTFEEGEPPVIPEGVNRVAATGNNAIIVSIVAGSENSSALVACDSDTKSKTSGLLKNRGIKHAEALWKNDGSSAGDLSAENLKKLGEDIAPDQIFVTSGSDTLTKEQKETLKNDYHINVYELPELSSATAIRRAVEIVGMTLDAGGVENAKANYENYLKVHDELIAKYAPSGMADGFDFDYGENTGVEPAETVVTLFVDGWDDTARYKDSRGYMATDSGVATATIGYATSPVTYYLSAGGVLNNAASKVMRQELKHNSASYIGSGIVWQFSKAGLPFDFSQWRKLNKSDLYDLCSQITGSRFKPSLTWHTSSGESGFGLGTYHFPAVIAKDQRIAGLLLQNSQGAHQPYYAYRNIYPTSGTTVGYWPKSGEEPSGYYVESCIGASIGAGQAPGSVFEGTNDSYGIYVNPKGLVQSASDDDLCSWTQGSLESVLEASWAHWMFRGGQQSEFEDDVVNFYSSVYGCDLTPDDLAVIEAGAVS